MNKLGTHSNPSTAIDLKKKEIKKICIFFLGFHCALPSFNKKQMYLLKKQGDGLSVNVLKGIFFVVVISMNQLAIE